MSCHDLVDFHYHVVAKHSWSIATRVLHLLHCLIRKKSQSDDNGFALFNATYCIFLRSCWFISHFSGFDVFLIISFIYIIRKCVTKLTKFYSFLNNEFWMKKINKQTLIAVLFFEHIKIWMTLNLDIPLI